MKPQDKKCASFTLIELLVVIAVIGLLASIVLVSFSGVRERARIAKMLDFSQSIQNVLGSEAVGVWTFDDCTAKDSSGYGNDGTINGASCVDETPQGAIGQGAGKYALSFNSAGDYVNVPPSPILDIQNNITLEAWIYPVSYPGDPSYILNKGGYFLNAGRNSNKVWGVRFNSIWYDSLTALSLNTWYHLVGTYDGNKVVLYLNGSVDRIFPEVSLNINPSGNPLYIGWSWGAGASQRFNGLIDEVRIYSKALGSAEIQKHYAQGLEKHKISAMIK